MVMTDLSLSGTGIHHTAVKSSVLLSGKDPGSVKDGTAPPPGGDPNPPPPNPPPQNDDYSPSSLGFSIPAYGGTLINSACVGVKAYLRSGLTTTPAPATNAAALATDAAVTSAGTAPAEGAVMPHPGGNHLIHDVSRVGTWMAGFATGIMTLKGGLELYSGIKNKNERNIISGAIDLSIGGCTALTAVPTLAPFAALTAVLLTGVKILSDNM